MGRVLRNKRDRRHARFAIAYVVGTSEDPERGAHEAFLSQVLDVAADVRQFPLGASPEDVRAYLDPDGSGPGCLATAIMPRRLSSDGSTVTSRGSDSQAPTPHGAKVSKAERTAGVANVLGISVDGLLDLRRMRAAATVGTKGFDAGKRARVVAVAIGQSVEFVHRWEVAEAM
jgi:hypothetical protein